MHLCWKAIGKKINSRMLESSSPCWKWIVPALEEERDSKSPCNDRSQSQNSCLTCYQIDKYKGPYSYLIIYECVKIDSYNPWLGQMTVLGKRHPLLLYISQYRICSVLLGDWWGLGDLNLDSHFMLGKVLRHN